MKPLNCGGCHACCEWGDDDSIRPMLVGPEELKLAKTIIRGKPYLAAKTGGACFYLDPMSGKCTIYNKRPVQCRFFDCRALYDSLKGKTFIKVVIAGMEKSDG